jgi:hypothetical protein
MSAGIVAVPPWGRWGGVNDRFAYGARGPMVDSYCGRERFAWAKLAAGTHKRNGEHLLRDVLREQHVDVRHTSAVFQRFRPTGLGPDDVLGMVDDQLEYLRDDLMHTITNRNQHWIRTAGKRARNTTAVFVCTLARKAVELRATWSRALPGGAAPGPAGADPLMTQHENVTI